MRQVVLSAAFLALVLWGCGRTEKQDAGNDDPYGAYAIPGPVSPDSGDEPKVHVVNIVQMKFVPEVLNVHKGDTVVFVNKDLVDHDVTELDRSLWTSSKMPGGTSWKMAATSSQTYYCSLHVVMRGKIIVDGNDIAMANAPVIAMCGG